MLIFSGARKVPSKLFEGVEFTFLKMTESRRVELLMAVAESDVKIQNALGQRDKMKKDAAESGLADYAAIARTNSIIAQVVASEQNPAKIKWALSSIKGAYLGDEARPVTLDNIGDWPSELVNEVIQIIDEGSVFDEEKSKNWPGLSICGAAADGPMKDSTAPLASEIVSIIPEIVPVTSQTQ